MRMIRSEELVTRRLVRVSRRKISTEVQSRCEWVRRGAVKGVGSWKMLSQPLEVPARICCPLGWKIVTQVACWVVREGAASLDVDVSFSGVDVRVWRMGMGPVRSTKIGDSS